VAVPLNPAAPADIPDTDEMKVIHKALLRFALLGPVQVWRGAAEVVIGTKQQRLLLALLLARAGRLVEVSDLIDFLWGQDVPPTAVNMVHRYVSSLRRVLQPGLSSRDPGRWLLRDVGGYRLVLNDGYLDLAEFRTSITAGRRLREEGDHTAATEAFLTGLKLWRGRCAAGLGAAVDIHTTSSPSNASTSPRYATPLKRHCGAGPQRAYCQHCARR
jgi:Transcriptional regulatory protein, C terminal/Bacterial transcriptional activator domain